jgi:hypothetical protein
LFPSCKPVGEAPHAREGVWCWVSPECHRVAQIVPPVFPHPNTQKSLGIAESGAICAPAVSALLQDGLIPLLRGWIFIPATSPSQRTHGRTGVRRSSIRRYMKALGWKWTPTMFIGSGCKVHLRDGELPMGRLVVDVSRHEVAVIDGVIHDTHDPSRDGTRCVYGYYQLGA